MIFRDVYCNRLYFVDVYKFPTNIVHTEKSRLICVMCVYSKFNFLSQRKIKFLLEYILQFEVCCKHLDSIELIPISGIIIQITEHSNLLNADHNIILCYIRSTYLVNKITGTPPITIIIFNISSNI